MASIRKHRGKWQVRVRRDGVAVTKTFSLRKDASAWAREIETNADRAVAALYLGKQEGKNLVYMGKVGSGWSRTVANQIRKQLDSVVSPKSKLTTPIRKPKATWVEPKFFADVEYRDITSEGLLRASSFKGLSRR
jgi:ATP-dependent DNA ligase